MSNVRQMDYGTPASRAEETVTLTVDGREITVPVGTSVMRASAEAGVGIPKLCATDMVDAFGSCRLCVVEIEGRRRESAHRQRVGQGRDSCGRHGIYLHPGREPCLRAFPPGLSRGMLSVSTLMRKT